MNAPDHDVLPAPVEQDDDLLTRTEASAFLERFAVSLKPATLARIWSVGGNGPPCQHVRSKPFYPRGELRAWALRQRSGLRTSKPPLGAMAGRRG